jgi:hypothetical protein
MKGEFLMRLFNRRLNLKKISIVLLAFMIGFGMYIPALAADEEYRMMRGEQDAIVVGTVKEVLPEGYLVEKADVIICKAENTLSRQLPEEEIPEKLLIEEINLLYSYHGRTEPQIGDHLVISVDKEGENWKQVWLALEVSSTDIATLEVMPKEKISTGSYAWQLFIRSDGEKVNFAYEGDNLLYLDGEVVFDKIEYLNALTEENVTNSDTSIELDASEQEYFSKNTQENNSVSISIIGGADGPTSIFLAGKLGTEFKITVALAVVLIIALIAVIIWRLVKK